MRIVKMMAVVVSLMAVMGLMGCSDSDSGLGTDTKFDNQSTSTVMVVPANDETFKPFDLAPGQSVTVERVGDKIDYTYTASGEVVALDAANVEVLFTDPINL